MVSTQAISVGSRYQVNESIRHGTMARLWDKITRNDRQQIALHLPAGGTRPGGHVATGIPKADFTRLMQVGSPTASTPQTGAARKAEVFTAHDVLAAASVPSWALQDDEAIDLAQQIGRGAFRFAFSAAPESMRGPLAALEAHDPKLAELVLDRLHGPGGTEAAEKHLESLLSALRTDPTGAQTARALEALELDLRAGFEERLEETKSAFLDSISSDLTNPSSEISDALQRLNSSTLSQLLVDNQGRLLSEEGLQALIDTYKNLSPGAAKSPAQASQLRALESLRDDAELRALVNSIGDSGTDAVRLAPTAERLVRAGVNRPGDQALTHADLRRSALSALLMPLRQGNVGSCFATSVGLLLKEAHPKVFVGDLKRMMEEGVMVRTGPGSPAVAHKIPISQQTDTSRLAALGSTDKAGHRLATMRALQAIEPDAKSDHNAINRFARNVHMPAADRIKAEAKARGSELTRTTPDEVLRKLVAERHGAQSVTGDIAATRERMRSLLTERSDLRERVVPESKRLKDMPAAELEAIRKKAADAQAEAVHYRASAKERVPTDLLYTTLRLADENKAAAAQATHEALLRQIESIENAPVTLDRAEKRLAAIDSLIQAAESDLVRFADAQMELDDVEAYEADLALTRSRFLARVDDPLLRAWEYTLASGTERAEAGRFSKQLKEGQAKALKAAIERQMARPDAPGTERKAPAAFPDALVQAFQRLFAARVSYRYDAATPTHLAADGHSSAGAWQLCITAGPGDTGPERPIIGKQAFKEFTSDLILEAARSLGPAERGKINARAFAEGLALELYTSDEFVEQTRDNLRANLQSNGNANPWLIPDGGVTLESITWAWGLSDRPSAPATFKPLKAAEGNTPEQLFDAALDNTLAAKALFTAEELKTPDRLALPASYSGHAFRLLPGHPDLRPLLEGKSDATSFKAELQSRGATLLSAPIPVDELNQIIAPLEQSLLGKGALFNKAMASLRQHLADQAAAGQPVSPGEIRDVLRSAIEREARPGLEKALEAEMQAEVDASPDLAAIRSEPSITAEQVEAWKILEIAARTEQAVREQIALYDKTAVEPLEARLFQQWIAPKACAAVADLNWGAGSDPQLMAFAFDPFKNAFETGVYQAGKGQWTTVSEFARKGLEIRTGPDLIRTPPSVPRFA